MSETTFNLNLRRFQSFFALAIAIPFLLIHAFLQARTSEIVDGLEAAKISFLNVTQRLKAESAAAR